MRRAGVPLLPSPSQCSCARTHDAPRRGGSDSGVPSRSCGCRPNAGSFQSGQFPAPTLRARAQAGGSLQP
eukprot:6118133-Pyramimonas_sp.AAC.1